MPHEPVVALACGHVSPWLNVQSDFATGWSLIECPEGCGPQAWVKDPLPELAYLPGIADMGDGT